MDFTDHPIFDQCLLSNLILLQCYETQTDTKVLMTDKHGQNPT